MDSLAQALIFLPVLLVSVVLHEVAHGWVALRQGDDTALRAGRLTLNPMPHLDPIGSLVVPMALLFLPGSVLFGWARPVPVNPRNFRDYRRGDILVSLAGVAVNLILAVVCVAVMVGAVWMARLLPTLDPVADVVYRMAGLGVILNLILAVFNLVPLPPLDGSHVLYHALPRSLRAPYRAVGKYGLLAVMGLVFLVPGFVGLVLWPAFALTEIALEVVRWLV
jgi:Zn-dependent protease